MIAPQLRSLDLSHNPLATAGGQHLCNALAGCVARLRTLSLSHTHIGDAGADSLGRLLSEQPCACMAELDVASCDIMAAGVASLAAGMRANGMPALTCLHLGHNPLREVCATHAFQW